MKVYVSPFVLSARKASDADEKPSKSAEIPWTSLPSLNKPGKFERNVPSRNPVKNSFIRTKIWNSVKPFKKDVSNKAKTSSDEAKKGLQRAGSGTYRRMQMINLAKKNFLGQKTLDNSNKDVFNVRKHLKELKKSDCGPSKC